MTKLSTETSAIIIVQLGQALKKQLAGAIHAPMPVRLFRVLLLLEEARAERS